MKKAIISQSSVNRVIRILTIVLTCTLIVGTMSGCKKKSKSSSSSLDGSSAISQEDSSNTYGVSVDASTESTQSNSSGSQAQSNNTSTKDPAVNPAKGVNLDGREISVITYNANGMFNRKKGLSAYLDSVAQRLNTLEKDLNCKVKITVKSVEDMQKNAFSTIASGTKYADIIEVPIYGTSAYISSKNVVDLNSVSTLDLSKDYMKIAGALNASTFYGKSYFLTCEDAVASTGMGYFFNKRILKETGLANPYDLVKNNQWTISKLREMGKAATKDKDGKPGMSKDDQWGIIQTSYVADAAAAVLSSVGAQMIKPDGAGGATYNTDSKEVLDAIALTTQMFVTDKIAYAKETGDSDLHNMFMTGKGLFLGCQASIAPTITDMDDEFGFVLFPRGDNAATFNASTNWNSSTLMIPVTPKTKNYDDAGHFLQQFCYLSSDTSAALYKEYSSRYFRDADSGQMMKKMAQTQNVSVSSILGATGDWGIHEGTYKILYNCVPGKASPIAEIQKFKPFSVSNLADLMFNLKK